VLKIPQKAMNSISKNDFNCIDKRIKEKIGRVNHGGLITNLLRINPKSEKLLKRGIRGRKDLLEKIEVNKMIKTVSQGKQKKLYLEVISKDGDTIEKIEINTSDLKGMKGEVSQTLYPHVKKLEEVLNRHNRGVGRLRMLTCGSITNVGCVTICMSKFICLLICCFLVLIGIFILFMLTVLPDPPTVPDVSPGGEFNGTANGTINAI